MTASGRETNVPMGDVFQAPEPGLEIEMEHLNHPHGFNQMILGLPDEQQHILVMENLTRENEYLIEKNWTLENEVKTLKMTINYMWSDNHILVSKCNAKDESCLKLKEENRIMGENNHKLKEELRIMGEIKHTIHVNYEAKKVDYNVLLEEISKLNKENEKIKSARDKQALQMHKLLGLWKPDQAEMPKKPSKADLAAAIQNVEEQEEIYDELDEGKRKSFRFNVTNSVRFNILLNERPELFRTLEKNEKTIRHLESKVCSLKTDLKKLKEKLSRADNRIREFKETINNEKESFRKLEENYNRFSSVVVAKLGKKRKIGLNGQSQKSHTIEMDDELLAVIKSLKKERRAKKSEVRRPKNSSKVGDQKMDEEMKELKDL